MPLGSSHLLVPQGAPPESQGPESWDGIPFPSLAVRVCTQGFGVHRLVHCVCACMGSDMSSPRAEPAFRCPVSLNGQSLPSAIAQLY